MKVIIDYWRVYAILIDNEGFFMHFFTVQGEKYCAISSNKQQLEHHITVFKTRNTAEKYAEKILNYRDSAEIIEVNSEEFNKHL